MSRSYWLSVITTVGYLTLVWLPSGHAAEPDRSIPQKEIFDALNKISSAIEKANEPKRETTDCAKGADDRKSDLCAQWKAADAAYTAAKAAEAAVDIGWWGVFLGFGTMVAAVAAAGYAKIAGDAAKRAVVNSETPYLAINARDIRFKPNHTAQEGNGDLWQITLKNLGSFPAKLTQIAALPAYTAKSGDTVGIPYRGKRFSDGFVISPGEEFHIQYSGVESNSVSEVQAGANNARFVGFVRYQNLFGVNYITRFSLEFDANRGEVFMSIDHNGTSVETYVPNAEGTAITRNPYIV